MGSMVALFTNIKFTPTFMQLVWLLLTFAQISRTIFIHNIVTYPQSCYYRTQIFQRLTEHILRCLTIRFSDLPERRRILPRKLARRSITVKILTSQDLNQR